MHDAGKDNKLEENNLIPNTDGNFDDDAGTGSSEEEDG
jgi:hypothetical protein